MAKEVDLLSYWMPILRQIREFREIAKTEEKELKLILEAIDRALANMFIETADEYGISRFEQMMGIIPNAEDDLEHRRLEVLIRWGDKAPYTYRTLYDKLYSLCGADRFSIVERYDEYLIEIVTHLGVKGSLDTVQSFLVEMLPCNMVLDLKNILDESSTTVGIRPVMVPLTAFRYLITNDIKENISTAEEGVKVTHPVLSTATTISLTSSSPDFEAVLGISSVLGSAIL